MTAIEPDRENGGGEANQIFGRGRGCIQKDHMDIAELRVDGLDDSPRYSKKIQGFLQVLFILGA
jgi:hypothetical protein